MKKNELQELLRNISKKFILMQSKKQALSRVPALETEQLFYIDAYAWPHSVANVYSIDVASTLYT